MSTSFANLRATFGLLTGIYRTVETTSAGAADGTTAISTNVKDQKDDFYIGWWVYAIDLATPSYRKCTDFVSSTGTFTFAVAHSAQVPTTSTLEIWRYDPVLVEESIKRQLEAIYPHLYKRVLNENLITGNWLRDGGFEEWSSSTALVFFTKSAAGLTLAQESTEKQVGTYAVKMTASAATQYILQNQANNANLLNLAGQTVTCEAWAYCATASHARLQIYQVDKDGNATTSNSDYHAGDSRWHLLSVDDIAIDADARTVELRWTADVNAGVSYFDHSRVVGPTLPHIYLPRTGWKDIQRVEVQVSDTRDKGTDLATCDDMGSSWASMKVPVQLYEDGTDTLLRYLDGYPAHSKRLRIIGTETLTVPASDSATTEIDSPETEYLLAAAAVRFYRSIPFGLPAKDVDYFVGEQARWEREEEKLKRKHRMMLPASSIRG